MPTRDEAQPAPATIITSERLQACRDVKPGTVLAEQDGTRMVVSNAYEAALAWWGRREAVRLAAELMASGVAMPDPWAEVTADDGGAGAGVPRGEGLAVEVCELLVMVNEHPSEDGPFTIGEESGLDRGHAQDRILVKAYEVVESKVKATEGGADQGEAAGSQSPAEAGLPFWMAVHEAGHVVVADALGLNPHAVTMTDEEVAVEIPMPEHMTPIEAFLSATVSHAGGLAQHKHGELPGPGTYTDLRNAAASIRVAAGDDAPASVLEILTLRASNLARAILEARWDVVLRVAQALVDGGWSLDRHELIVLLIPDGEYMALPDDCCEHFEALASSLKA
jgi:hypothetical protein